jgi:MFS family permease
MINKAKLMICLMALSVALAGYVSCLLASHIRWHLGWITAPATLPGFSFGLIIAGWLLHRGWIGRRKAVGFVIASAVAYFAAYWSAVYTIALCGGGMIFSTSRLPLFHAGMIAGLAGTALLTASLAVVSADFRRQDWKTLIIIGTAVGGALCLGGIGATSNTEVGTLANPGDRFFVFAWQVLVSGYIGMLLWAGPGSATPQRSRFGYRAAVAVLALLVLSFTQAAIGYVRAGKQITAVSPATLDKSDARRSTPARADTEGATQKKVPVIQQSSPSPSSQSDKDVATFLAILAGKTPNPPVQGPQSDNSLAVERYLRSRLVGGLTDKQVTQLSAAIAREFDAANIGPKQRSLCLTGEGDKRYLYLYIVHSLASGELTPAETKEAANQLVMAILHMIPPRAVFNDLFAPSPSILDAKPMAAVDGDIHLGPRKPGMLIREHLESFKHAIYYLTGQNKRNKESPLAYWSQVDNLKAGDVLYCVYQTESADLISRPFYFWYQKVPDGLSDLLKTLPVDHPIRQIGPPRDSAPDSYTLALQANQETRTLVRESEEDLEKWRAAEAKRKKDAGGGFVDFLAKMAEAGIMLGLLEKEKEKQHYEHVEQIIAESGGKKIKCPTCNASGKVLDSTYNSDPNPHPYLSLEHSQFEDSRTRLHLITCSKCGGEGWVYAK